MQLSQIIRTWRIFGIASMVTEFFGGIWAGTAFVGQRMVIPYSAAPVPNAALANYFTLTITDGVAIVFGVPLNPPPAANYVQRITILIVNASGGAHGAITWNAIYHTAATPFPAVANGFNRQIAFVWSGTAWLQESYAADVAN